MKLPRSIFNMEPYFRYIVLCILVGFTQSLSGVSDVDRNYINHLSGSIRTVDREQVGENKFGYTVEDVIAKLRALDSEYIAAQGRLLVRLRDEPTIEKYVSLFLESEGTSRGASSVLANAYSPWIIPLLIEALDAQEIELYAHPQPEFGPHWGLSGVSAQVIQALLVTSEEFSDELRNWARGLPRKDVEPLRELRDILKFWWEENEEHFENEDYHLVRPASRVLGEDVEESIEEKGTERGQG